MPRVRSPETTPSKPGGDELLESAEMLISQYRNSAARRTPAMWQVYARTPTQ
jgi:hypothetical protein